MSRFARVVVPGFPHHVTQRGNRQADVFEDDEDRRAYLRFLKQYAERRGLSVWAYCLMTNHVHLVVVPEREDSLAKGLRDAHTVYAMRFNTRTGLSGHVWQGRFYYAYLMNRISGPRCAMWSATRCVRGWWTGPKNTCGRVRRLIAACAPIRYYRTSFLRRAS
ncbi:MAG: transposase [Candidatus Hydrogenedentales bacterium]|jgi:REP element-mobilizing transposase RayT